MLLIILGALLLIGLVIVHELGHFYAARRAGIEVEEFGIGFPPRAKELGKKNGTLYTLNWLPLGGFVKLKGEHDSDTAKGSFGAASTKEKILVMVAGVGMNLVVAVLLMSVVAAVRLPKFIDNQFMVSSDTRIVEDKILVGLAEGETPAKTAGLQDGDAIRSIKALEGCDGECRTFTIDKPEDLSAATTSLAGKQVEITYQKNNGDVLSGKTTLLTKDEVEESRKLYNECVEAGKSDCPSSKGYLGVFPDQYIAYRSTWSAPVVGVVVSGQIVQESLKQLGAMVADLFRGDTTKAENGAVGIVGIGYVLGSVSEQGLISVLFLVAIISLSLAIMNILPIPALDGGRLFVMLLFRFIKKPLSKETEERIHGTGFALLMVLFLLITILDVQRFIIK